MDHGWLIRSQIWNCENALLAFCDSPNRTRGNFLLGRIPVCCAAYHIPQGLAIEGHAMFFIIVVQYDRYPSKIQLHAIATVPQSQLISGCGLEQRIAKGATEVVTSHDVAPLPPLVLSRLCALYRQGL